MKIFGKEVSIKFSFLKVFPLLFFNIKDFATPKEEIFRENYDKHFVYTALLCVTIFPLLVVLSGYFFNGYWTYFWSMFLTSFIGFLFNLGREMWLNNKNREIPFSHKDIRMGYYGGWYGCFTGLLILEAIKWKVF